ncbi:Tetratricopeptide repeat-domain-containing protein [Xylaria sp. FL0064]|nr:Tetratricopeptide repeat-domain-containing protein [Xylaria sp. FL0064]
MTDDLGDSLSTIRRHYQQPLVTLLLDIQKTEVQHLKSAEFMQALECLYFPTQNDVLNLSARLTRIEDARPSTILMRRRINTVNERGYAAISYTWHHPLPLMQPCGKYFVQSRKGEFLQSDIQDSVFERVEKYMIHFNLRYLWIDQECLVQEDGEEKTTAIQAMDLVYGRSRHPVSLLYQPIMSIAELKWLAGLMKGGFVVKSGSEFKLSLELPRESACKILELLEAIVSDIWWTRAWTYQENYRGNININLLIPHYISSEDYAELANYLPFSQQGSILFTTRNHQVAVQLDIPQKNIITIQEMDNAEATKLLRKGLKESQISDAENTKHLLRFLANFPLAIKQASAYMASNINVTISQYLEFCESSNIDLINLLGKQFKDRHRYKSHAQNQNPVATTWLISFEHISRYNPQAADYLKFVCFLAEKDIPLSLLPVASKMQMAEAIGLLSAYAFILERDTSGSFDIHRLVRLVMRSWLQEKGEWEKWTVNVVQRLVEEYPFPRHENRETWTKYLPHGQAVLELDGAVNTEENSSLLFNMAESYSILGKYDEAETMHRQTLELREEVLGREHPSTLDSMNNLALVLNSQGKYNEAETIHRQTLELREEVLGREHPEGGESRSERIPQE